MEEYKTHNEEPAGLQETEYITRAEALAMEQDILDQVRRYADQGRARAESSIKALAEEVQSIREAMLQTTNQ